MEFRCYQREAIDALYSYFSASDGNPLVVMPTGTGKSVVIAGFCREALEAYPGTRILVLTHVKELIAQNYLAMLRVWPEAPAGVYSAGLNRRDLHTDIVFAGIASIRKRAYQVQRCDLVLIDEAQLIGREVSGMYRTFLDELKEINNGLLKVVGFTATPYRLDSGMLHEGKDRLFTEIAYDLPMLKMIEQGYLCPVVPRKTDTELDVSSVGKRGGEFIPAQLEAAVDQDKITSAAVDEIVRRGEGRGSWLVFCSGVKHALHVRDEIRKWGIECETVTGETNPAERDRILSSFKDGRLQALTNANVLTTGFDAPGVDLIAMLRPTDSVGLYVQMVGRGTRLAEGKDDCLVLDFAGNTKRHGPVDQAKGRSKKEQGEGVPPTKVCPECQTIVAAATRECACGFLFPEPKVRIDAIASRSAVLSTQIKPEWIDVVRVSYRAHNKPDKPTSLEVTYHCGLASHREWVCFEHTGFPRQKACDWWAKRNPGVSPPKTVADALQAVTPDGLGTVMSSIKTPLQILVLPVGKYVEIKGVNF